jgi:2-amino-4-hydroxy-6-hydroxymethyldihydropteridine diphosphokinase
MSEPAYVALGSNLGSRRETLQKALVHLSELPRTTLQRCSSLYATSPVGGPPQPDFLNAVIFLETSLTPEELLKHLHGIENLLGRQRSIHWGPRTLDLDLLALGAVTRASEDPKQLQLPHPRLQDRQFVLVPLLEVAPNWKHPVLRQSVEALLEKCPDPSPPQRLDTDWTSFLFSSLERVES